MQSVKTLLIILVCAALLGACGNRGPLYLPEDKPVTEQEAATDNDTDKEKKNSKKDNAIPR